MIKLDWMKQPLLCYSVTAPYNPKDDWDGTIYARHGGEIGPKWWMQVGKKASRFYKCRNFPTSLLHLNFQLCVYVRKEIKSMSELRNRYLSCIGGQNVLYCGAHKLPLILNPTKKRQQATTIESNDANHDIHVCRCCCKKDASLELLAQKSWMSVDTYCEKNGSLVCAHVGCHVAVCDKHFSSIMVNSEGSIYMLTRGACSIGSVDEITHVPTTNMANALDEIDDDTSSRASSCRGPVHEHDNVAVNLGPCDSYEYAGELLPELEEYDSDDADDETSDTWKHFHNTSAATEMMDVDFEAPDEIASCPLHVLLNQQGHLLVRKKSKLRMNRRHANFFQRIVATTRGKTLPLAYAESLLFPDIFFFSTGEGSILGAIPTALWTDEKMLNSVGIASMRKHAKARLLDPATLCSTDARYHFMTFDCLVNLGMRGNDSRLVLHRGFASRQDGDGVAFNKSDNAELYSDTAENHSNVHKLAALIAESPPHYFFTQSCNQSTCRGLKKLRQWITSAEAIVRVQDRYGISYEEASRILRTTAAPYIQRVWDVIADLWMRYIVNSKEEPLHKIDWAWWRKEFQDEAGNLSHIHAILRTSVDINTESGRNAVLEKIRGSLADLVQYQELMEMREIGLIDSLDNLGDIYRDAISFLTHRCNSRCQIPKLDDNGEVTFVCKVPANTLLSPQPQIHTIQPVDVRHSPTALAVLLRLGLARESLTVSNRKNIEITHPMLKMERHIPKCSQHDAKFSPTNGRLFVMMPSSQNLQYCTGHSLALYLTSYVTEIDRVSLIFIRPPTTDMANTLRLEHHSLNNTKIRSVAKYHADNLKKNMKTKNLPCGRAITHMEALTVIYGSGLIFSTRDFVHYPTCPREYRAALFVPYLQTTCKPQDLVTVRAVTGQTVRNELDFPVSRCFSPNQLRIIKDEIVAPLSTDQLTYFSMRPPELRFIRQQSLYLKWFERKAVTKLYDPTSSFSYLNDHLSLLVSECEWLDGFNYKVVLHRPAIRPCLEYAMTCPARNFGIEREGMLLQQDLVFVLKRLLYLYELIELKIVPHRVSPGTLAEWHRLSTLFLSDRKSKLLPVPWFTPVSPKRKNAFLVQLLLSMGEFDTEYELMLSGNLRDAFIAAKLFDPVHAGASVDSLLKRYVLEHLRTFPGNHYQFDRNLCLAESNLREVLLGTTPCLDMTPSVLYTHMKNNTDEKIEEHIEQERSRLIETLHSDLSKCGFSNVLPTKERIQTTRQDPMSDQEITFYPPPLCPRQNQISYAEQQRVLESARSCINRYADPTATHKNLAIVGGPGVGKTTVCQFITLYALCRGLNGTASSLVADRSKQLGGTHIHRLFGLRGVDTTRSPGRIAERTIHDLYHNPELLWLLVWLDFLFLDEFGLLSAELLAILDMILRYVRRSSCYMGGVLIVTTIDVKQLMPFQGVPAMLSIFVILEYQFVELTQSVRASADPALQEICNLTRTVEWTTEKQQRLAYLLSENCNFVDDFNSVTIPEDAVFIFGRRAPCHAAENLMLDRMKSLHVNNYVIAHANDEQSTTAGNWRVAAAPTTRRLSKIIKRKEELLFYPKARFEFTYNGEKDQFMQGQLALCMQVPSLQSIEDNEPITVFKAPAGLKEFPTPSQCNETELRQLGWRTVKVPYSTTRPENVFGGIQARRTQYGLKPRVASTIHGCMGASLSSVVTALVSLNGSSLDFSLWESAQVVVLLSRTQRAKDIYFVGDKHETIKHILDVLQKTHRYLPYIISLLTNLCHETTETPIYDLPPLYRPCDAIVGHVQCVYVIVSTRDVSYTYIGETANMGRRLNEHCTGTGAKITSYPALQPWGLLGYVTGFRDKQERLNFEALWKETCRRQHIQHGTAESILHVAHSLIQSANENRDANSLLRLIRCGHVSSNLNTTSTMLSLH
jgi:predicted GIY-YIG superfamily endonuclease